MVDYNKVISGITMFVDTEIIPKMTGLSKWAFGTGIGIASKKAENLFNQYKTHPVLKALDLVEGDKINVETLYEELYKQASKGTAVLDIPMIGTVTLDQSDVDKLYNYIMR